MFMSLYVLSSSYTSGGIRTTLLYTEFKSSEVKHRKCGSYSIRYVIKQQINYMCKNMTNDNKLRKHILYYRIVTVNPILFLKYYGWQDNNLD